MVGVGILAVLRLMAIDQPAFDIVLALGVGISVGSLMLLLYGTPSNEPDANELVDALKAAGLRPRRVLRVEEVESELACDVVRTDDRRYDLFVRTPDERDADVLARAYRAVRFQASEVGAGYASIKRRLEGGGDLTALRDFSAKTIDRTLTGVLASADESQGDAAED